MGRPNKETQAKLNAARQKAMEDIFKLHKDAEEHIRASLKSTRICAFCDAATGTASRKDSEGKCLNCHGTNLIPDWDQRSWAADQIFSRTLPKPKAAENVSDNADDLEEDKLDKYTPEQLEQAEKLLEEIGRESGNDKKGAV